MNETLQPVDTILQLVRQVAEPSTLFSLKISWFKKKKIKKSIYTYMITFLSSCSSCHQPSAIFLVLHFQLKKKSKTLMANAMSTAEDRRLKGSIASWFTTLRAMGTTNWHLTTSKVANYHWKPRQKRQGQIKISQKILVILGRLFNIGLWIDKLCHINWCSAV